MFKDKEQCLFSESSNTMYSFVHIWEGCWRYWPNRVVAGSGTASVKGSRRLGDLCLAMCGNLQMLCALTATRKRKHVSEERQDLNKISLSLFHRMLSLPTHLRSDHTLSRHGKNCFGKTRESGGYDRGEGQQKLHLLVPGTVRTLRYFKDFLNSGRIKSTKNLPRNVEEFLSTLQLPDSESQGRGSSQRFWEFRLETSDFPLPSLPQWHSPVWTLVGVGSPQGHAAFWVVFVALFIRWLQSLYTDLEGIM